MNEMPVGPEVITLAGVRERKAAYEEECKRKEKSLAKSKITVFRVEDGAKIGEEAFHSIQGSFNRSADALDVIIGHETNGAEHHHHHNNNRALGLDKYSSNDHDNDDKSVGADELDLEPDELEPDDSAYFDYSARPGFFRGGSFGDSDSEKEAPKVPVEKTQEQLAKDAKEEEAKKTFTILLEKNQSVSSSQAPVILQSFSSLQKRYLSAVAELRPAVDDSSMTPSSGSFNKQRIKAELRKEANRKEQFSTLKNSYYAYAEAVQDKREEVEDICVEEEIEKLEDEVVEEWVDYAEKAVEKVEILVAATESEETSEGDDDDDLAEMEKWREEAKKLKEEANERKQRKAEQEAFRAERKEKAKQRAKERAMYLKKKKERAAAEKRAEEEQAAAKQEQEDEAEQQAQDAEETNKREESEAAAEAELEVDDETELAEAAEEPKKKANAGAAEGEEHKKKADHDAKKKTDHEKKKSDHGKKKKKEEKSKDEKKKKDKKKKGDDDGENKGDDEVDKKKGGNESDGEDAPDEKFPRNLDGSIWKNVLKFWTNKPKYMKEKSSKVIITTTPGSDCFRPTATSGSDNASFYWHKVEGDFDCVVHIKGEFANAYDKAGIMLRVDEKTWMMSGVEYFGEQLNNASCITRQISDWSLAPLPAEAKKGCWFCVKRVGNKVETFYSMDTKTWIQTRQALFTDAPTIKVGIATGSPKGEGFKVTFDRFWMKKK